MNVNLKSIEAVAFQMGQTFAAAMAELGLPLFVQRGRFPEGCMPGPDDTHRLAAVNKWVVGAFGLDDSRTTYKIGMTGFGQGAGGFIILNRDKDFEPVIALKGDAFMKGKFGVIGGQGKDKHRGNYMAMALDETKEEVGFYAFDKERMFQLIETMEYRGTNPDGTYVDGRGEYWIRAGFTIYIASQSEVDAIIASYKAYMETDLGKANDEIAQLFQSSFHDIMAAIRDSKMVYYDQTQAFLAVALARKYLEKAWGMLAAAGIPRDDETLWKQAALISHREFKALTATSSATPDWRTVIDPDVVCFGKAA